MFLMGIQVPEQHNDTVLHFTSGVHTGATWHACADVLSCCGHILQMVQLTPAGSPPGMCTQAAEVELFMSS